MCMDVYLHILLYIKCVCVIVGHCVVVVLEGEDWQNWREFNESAYKGVGKSETVRDNACSRHTGKKLPEPPRESNMERFAWQRNSQLMVWKRGSWGNKQSYSGSLLKFPTDAWGSPYGLEPQGTGNEEIEFRGASGTNLGCSSEHHYYCLMGLYKMRAKERQCQIDTGKNRSWRPYRQS